jgi:hypothetical protein
LLPLKVSGERQGKSYIAEGCRRRWSSPAEWAERDSNPQPDPEKKSRIKKMAWMLVGGFMGTAGSEGATFLGQAAKAGVKAIGGS